MSSACVNIPSVLIKPYSPELVHQVAAYFTVSQAETSVSQCTTVLGFEKLMSSLNEDNTIHLDALLDIIDFEMTNYNFETNQTMEFAKLTMEKFGPKMVNQGQFMPIGGMPADRRRCVCWRDLEGRGGQKDAGEGL